MDDISDRSPPMGKTRRKFLQQLGAASVVTATSGAARLFTESQPPSTQPLMKTSAASESECTIFVLLRINGSERRLELEPRAVLLDVLREKLDLTGAKKGCDHGQCGACTVIINGRRVKSCLSLAVMHEGDAITTIEGLASDGQLHPLQQAFIERDAFQCGGCTTGQIMSAVALLDEPIGSDRASLRDAMSGNICRCGAYQGICEAIESVRRNRTVKGELR